MVELLNRIQPDATQLGTSGDVEVFRWEDPSGARLVFGVSAGSVIDFVPSFAAQPGVNLRSLRVLNEDVIAADVVDDDGEQTTALAFELEQRRATLDSWAGRAAMTAFAPGAEFFADEQDFAASPSSLVDPDADPGSERPAEFRERGVPWPMRMAPESFISYALFAQPEDAQAQARMNGVVTDVQTRTNVLTGESFLVCRVRLLGSEFDLVTVLPEGVQPAPGYVVAGYVFLVASIEDLAFPKPKRRLFRRRD
jgi:hypothetical protein